MVKLKNNIQLKMTKKPSQPGLICQTRDPSYEIRITL
jgi:hypothetical protein